MRLGILGGTFDPVHIAHVVIAERVRDACELDELVFVPAASPPHKDDAAVTPFEDRYRMIELAIAGNPRFAVSSIESLRPGKSFTVDTLEEMSRAHPEAELYWIVGADSACELHLWRDPERLVTLAKFIVVGRPGWSLDDADPWLRNSMITVDMPEMDICSTEIRARVREGKSIQDYVPDKVLAYIEEHGLYKS